MSSPGGPGGVGAAGGSETGRVGHAEAAHAPVQAGVLQSCAEARRLALWRVRVVRLQHRVIVVVLHGPDCISPDQYDMDMRPLCNPPGWERDDIRVRERLHLCLQQLR